MLTIKGVSSYFHIYRPLTPPYVPFDVRQFQDFTFHDMWQVVFLPSLIRDGI